MNFGFIKVATATPKVKVADCFFNIQQIELLIQDANFQGVEIICFPELAITAYTCGDLFFQKFLLDEAEKALDLLVKNTKELDILAIVGMPIRSAGKLFNTAVVFQKGKIIGIIPKTHLPNYNEFYEKRWFSSALETNENHAYICGETVPFGHDLLFKSGDVCIGVEVCEDLWQPIPPSSNLALNGATVLFNLSASDEIAEKNNYRRSLVAQQSARCVAGYVYAASGPGESSTDLVFSGSGFICENGALLQESNRFSFENQLIIADIDVERLHADRRKNNSFTSNCSSDKYRYIPFDLKENDEFSITRKISPTPFVPANEVLNERCDEIFAIQTSGLMTRLLHTGIQKLVLGISGGLDSTLALLVCIKTFDKLNFPRHNIIGITMPGFGTTDRTYGNAVALMQTLGIQIREIDIKPASLQHFKDIGHDIAIHDVTYENTQARERTQILMDIANKEGGLVIGTGDLSEMALGWSTYNGDHMSMYAVNCSIPKTLIRYIIKRTAENQLFEAADILYDILDTPVSPELLPADKNGQISQKTEDLIGPYELHDFFLYYFIRWGFSPRKIFYLTQHAFQSKFSAEVTLKWMTVFFKRFFSQQFKRSCVPDGPKVGSVSLSPRGDWRMPSDASAKMWMNELEKLKKTVL